MCSLKKSYAFFAVILISGISSGFPEALAGSESSGGGAAIICYMPGKEAVLPKSFVGDLPPEALDPANIESITQYDLYHAQKKEEGAKRFADFANLANPAGKFDLFEVIPPKPDQDHKAYYGVVLDKVRNLSPTLAKILQDAHASFDFIEKRRGIEPMSDFTDVWKEDRPSRCGLVQLARQRTIGEVNELDMDSRFFFHPKHSLQSQVTIFFHEDGYLYGRVKRNHTTSDATRALVAQFLNKNVSYERFFRAARNFGIDVRDSTPYLQAVAYLASVKKKVADLDAADGKELATLSNRLRMHPYFASRNPAFPDPYVTRTKELSDMGINPKDNTPDGRPFMERMAAATTALGVIEFWMNAPVFNERLSQRSINYYKSQHRGDLVREETKLLKKSQASFAEMDRYLSEFAPIRDQIRDLAARHISALESLLNQEFKNRPSAFHFEPLNAFIDEQLKQANEKLRDVPEAWSTLVALTTFRREAIEVIGDNLIDRAKANKEGSFAAALERAREENEKLEHNRKLVVDACSAVMPPDDRYSDEVAKILRKSVDVF